MNGAFDQDTSKSGHDNATREMGDIVKSRVMDYWREHGLADQYLVEQLAEECIAHARRRVGPDAQDELLKRALDDVQRRVDHAIARAMGFPPAQEQQAISAARAALLLAHNRVSTDALFLSAEASSEAASILREILPRSTPPEAHVTMKETPLSFWLFKSTHR